MNMNTTIRRAVGAALLAVVATASQAATFQSTFDDFNLMAIGGATSFNSTDTFEITNNTGSTWQSFAMTSSPKGVTFSNYSGPGFADMTSGLLQIGGIAILNGGVLIFTVKNSSNGTRTFSGTPSTEAIAAPVPLPASAALLLAGLGLLGARARRRTA